MACYKYENDGCVYKYSNKAGAKIIDRLVAESINKNKSNLFGIAANDSEFHLMHMEMRHRNAFEERKRNNKR